MLKPLTSLGRQYNCRTNSFPSNCLSAVVNETGLPTKRENPFRSRRIRPGAIPFFFPAGQNAETFVERLGQNNWRGEIVGSHGSGKSSLLAALIPVIEKAGRNLILLELHDGQRRLPSGWDRYVRSAPSPIILVDGYEQLSRWSRFWLRIGCRRNGWGLLVTTHASVGLPPLYQTEITFDLAKRIVAHLTQGKTPPSLDEALAKSLAAQGGNLRETLFDLYDLYE